MTNIIHENSFTNFEAIQLCNQTMYFTFRMFSNLIWYTFFRKVSNSYLLKSNLDIDNISFLNAIHV